jgi:hypothetical protein
MLFVSTLGGCYDSHFVSARVSENQTDVHLLKTIAVWRALVLSGAPDLQHVAAQLASYLKRFEKDKVSKKTKWRRVYVEEQLQQLSNDYRLSNRDLFATSSRPRKRPLRKFECVYWNGDRFGGPCLNPNGTGNVEAGYG